MFDPTNVNNADSTPATSSGSGGHSGDSRPLGDLLPDRSPEVRHVLFGPEAAVKLTISNLHRRGYAEPNDWCKPQPTGQPGEVMSVLIKRVPLN
jgi:hypothetical protein